MPALTSLALGGGALLGGLAGALTSKNGSSSHLDAGQATNLENTATGAQQTSLQDLINQMQGGPGTQDVNNAYKSNTDFAGLLDSYARSGGTPTDGDISTGNNLASKLFAGQRESLNQDFNSQNTSAQRMAAQLGRPVDDPVLQAKLRTGMMNQTAQLNANQSATGTQLAMQLPGQRLSYASGANDVRNNLAAQAMNNRNLLLGLGSQVAGGERSFRMNTGTQYGEQSSGGGLKGGIEGALGGFGAMAGSAKGLSSLFPASKSTATTPFSGFSNTTAQVPLSMQNGGYNGGSMFSGMNGIRS